MFKTDLATILMDTNDMRPEAHKQQSSERSALIIPLIYQQQWKKTYFPAYDLGITLAWS